MRPTDIGILRPVADRVALRYGSPYGGSLCYENGFLCARFRRHAPPVGYVETVTVRILPADGETAAEAEAIRRASRE